MSIDDDVERVRAALIKRLSTREYLHPKGLIHGLAADTSVNDLTVRQALARLAKSKWLEGATTDGTPIGRIRIIGQVPKEAPDPAQERWQLALNSSGLEDPDRKALLPLAIKLADFDSTELQHILTGLIRLRSSLAYEAGRHRFLVSSQYLLGSSKLLDSLSSPALRRFGITIDEFPSHPLYVMVAGATSPEAVVLVENPAAFELAVTTRAVERCAFVATFGFGLSASQEDFGNQLANMAEDHFAQAVTLVREGSACPAASQLLKHPNITFWGDLDPAGIMIYLRLKKRIPDIQLSALYTPMISALRNSDQSHPYVSVVGKPGQSALSISVVSSDPVAARLLDLCVSRGVDQEQVALSKIESLARHQLELGQLHV